MSFTNQTTHYALPQWIGSDKPTYLVDQNNAYQTIDSEIYNANVTAGEAVTTANGAASTAGAASATAADALSAAQTASSTADSALTAAQDAGTVAQAAQTAAGAAQTAAQAAQEAAAGNSITNLAPAYDSTITYAIDDLVTQDGKLYKCIVAVTSPEQFDINKWDDVTTSEVYAKSNAGYVYINSYNKQIANDTTKTSSAFLLDAITSIINSIQAEMTDNEIVFINGVFYKNSYHTANYKIKVTKNSNVTSALFTSLRGGGNIINEYIEYYKNSNVSITRSTLANDSTISYSVLDNVTNDSAITLYYEIYKAI